MSMTPEQFVERLSHALPERLRSVVLYGSAAAGDHIAGASDYNLLVVADRLGLAELNALSAPVAAWVRAGHRPPRLFTAGQLASSADAFPIELLDMRQSRKVLFGDDPLVGIRIEPAALRLQVEREWKARILRLREGYVASRGRRGPVVDLMTASLSTVLVLCRATLRLYEADVPPRKLDALRALAQRLGFDPRVFLEISGWTTGRRPSRGAQAASAFETYLAVLERIADAASGFAGGRAGAKPA